MDRRDHNVAQIRRYLHAAEMSQDEKPCTMCGVPKPPSHFHKNKRVKSGLRARCKECEKVTLQEWRTKNPEKYKAQQQRNLEQNREQRYAMTQAWRERNKEHVLEYARRWYRENEERAAVNRERFREKNPDYFRTWHKLNREKSYHNVKVRAARIRGAGGTYTFREWQDLCERFGNKCLCCGDTESPLTRDHVIPVSRGGSNYIDNLQPLCGPCNRAKGVGSTDYRGVGVE